MKKVIISAVVFIVVLACAFLVILHVFAPQRSLCVSNPDELLGKMPLSGVPLVVEVAPGMKFKIDTGADISSICESDLARLQKLGYEVTPSPVVGFGRDGHGRYGVYTNAIRVRLPMFDYETALDSLGNAVRVSDPIEVNALENVDLFVIPDIISTFGIDFLEKFKVEYLYADKAIALHESLPPGYQKLVEIEPDDNILTMPYTGHRYYMNIGVEHNYHDYLLDTGQQLAMLKLPPEDTSQTSNYLVSDTIYTYISASPARVDNNAWVEIGHRVGTRQASYYSNREEDYCVNPLTIFTQDMLIDFPGRMIYLRPYCVPNSIRNVSHDARF